MKVDGQYFVSYLSKIVVDWQSKSPTQMGMLTITFLIFDMRKMVKIIHVQCARLLASE